MAADSLKPRQHRRRAVSLAGSCRSSDGRARGVELTDLSEGGCRLRLPLGTVERDELVTVRPPTLEPVAGVVRWTDGEAAGIAFRSDLYPAVVDHLAGRAPLVAEVPRTLPADGDSGLTDKFGRPLPALGQVRKRS